MRDKLKPKQKDFANFSLLMVQGVTPAHKGLAPSRLINYISVVEKDAHAGHTQCIKIIGQLSLNSMVKAFLRGRQIFKFGLLRKKDNKKNLKIRLVFNRMVVAFFRPTILIQDVSKNLKTNRYE